MKKFLYSIYRRWHQFRGPRITVGVRALVVDDAGRVCLVRHTYRDGWFLPGGGVKVGESLVDAMSRELAEETGIELPESPRRVLGVYSSEVVADAYGAFAIERVTAGEHTVAVAEPVEGGLTFPAQRQVTVGPRESVEVELRVESSTSGGGDGK